MFEELRSYVERTLDALRPCSTGIVVSQGEQIVYEAYLPGVEPQLPRRAINAHSRWPLWSATKSFVGVLLLTLAHDGLLTLDDPVADYLSQFSGEGDGPFSREKVTFRHLASHTSGLELPEERPAAGEIDLESLRVLTEPGSEFLYSWMGMHVLERAMEAAAGEDLEVLMQTRILAPLGLKETGYVYDYDPELPLLPCKAGDLEGPREHFSFIQNGYRAGSGLYATARDLNRFCQLLLGDGSLDGRSYFTPELKREAWTLHSIRPSDGGRYGLLWWLFEKEGGYVASGASSTVSAVVPGTGAVVTVTRNHVGGHPGPFNFLEDKRALVRFGARLR